MASDTDTATPEPGARPAGRQALGSRIAGFLARLIPGVRRSAPAAAESPSLLRRRRSVDRSHSPLTRRLLLLKSLAERPGHVKNRDQLMDAAYGETIYVDDRTIDSHIKRVRRKFREVDGEFEQIETLYGIGYRYRDA